jgi:hypothetical protein
MASYAVIWREGPGGICVGQLESLRRGFRLDGADRSGTHAACDVRASDVVSVTIGRASADRIDGRATLIVERSTGSRLLIASAMGVGLLHEIADRIGKVVQTGRARPPAP